MSQVSVLPGGYFKPRYVYLYGVCLVMDVCGSCFIQVGVQNLRTETTLLNPKQW